MLLNALIAPLAVFIAHTVTSTSAALAVFLSSCSHTDWFRVAGAREPCLYLIPDYDAQEEAEEILEEVYEDIFEAELDFWHRGSGTWPAERTSPVFRKWFEVRLYPLIQDLMGEKLSATGVDEEFIVELRTSLEGLEQQS